MGPHIKIDKPLIFISNHVEQLDKYKDRGICLTSKDLLLFLGSNQIPDVALKVFPDSKFELFKADSNQWW